MYLGLQKSVTCQHFLSKLCATGKEALEFSMKHLAQEKMYINFLSIFVCAQYTSSMSKIKQK